MANNLKPTGQDAQVAAVIAGVALLGVWVLTRKPEPPPPPPPPPPGKGNLYGVISDKSSGEVVPGASITLTASDGSIVTTTTDAAGAYGLLDLPVNITVDWDVTADGYTPAAGSISLVEGNQLLNVEIDPIPPPGNNVITFGALSGTRVPAIDAGGNPLTWSTINLDCQVTNDGPATTREIQIWAQPEGYPNDPGVRATIALPMGANSSVPFAYRGNPVGAGSILLQSNTLYYFRLIDAGSGSVSETIRR